jgi:choline dehydrogenase-like flavoprotein
MIEDFRRLNADEIECDLCIAGAGAAGITLARAFAGRAEKVVVLESGGFSYEYDVQALYIGQNIGVPYNDLDVTRLRFFGGSTNHWGGMCIPLDEGDFLGRAWLPYTGWPITRATVDPYYPLAQPILDVGAFDYDAQRLGGPAPGLLELGPDLVPAVYRMSVPPTLMGDKYRAELAAAGNVTVLLHANLTDIQLAGPDQPVTGFEVHDLAGKRAVVRARVYVLALGGIENPRMLLNSDRVQPGGVANQHDLVGRFFHDHIGVPIGLVMPLDPAWLAPYQQFVHAQGTEIWQAIAASDALMEREQIGNVVLSFGPIRQLRKDSKGYKALHTVKRDVQAGKWPDRLGSHLWDILTDLGGIAAAMQERFSTVTQIYTQAEQAPDPDSRVLLDQERDALGLRRAMLDWRVSEIDRRTNRVLGEAIVMELGRLGLARVQLAEWMRSDEVDWTPEIVPSNHHIGTTRMADHPSQGVVDPDCRTFAHDNLFIAGSSVFPSSGFANPTLTIVALTLRLADHLKEWLETMPPRDLRADAPRR